LDNIVCIFVIGVLVVFYWRGTWLLLDYNLYPEDVSKNVWICVAIGNGGLFLAAIFQETLKKHVMSPSNICIWIFYYHFHSYAMGFFSVCHWRGIWNGLDHYTGRTDESYLYSLLVGQTILFVLRSSRMISGPPSLVLFDTGKSFFNCDSRFEQTPDKPELYTLDHLLSVVVIMNCVVLVWRGVWGLGDNYFYPDDLEKSCWLSIGVGFGVLLVNIPLQILGNIIYRWSLNKGWPLFFRVVLEDLLHVVSGFGVIHHWRGVWLMQDVYFFPDHENLSLSPGISHITGYLGLALILTSMSNATIGSYVSGSAPASTGCFLENYYFRYYFSK
ncbi:hypothetical protein CAPTEDRAFT_24879, partial [Capitella teleta]